MKPKPKQKQQQEQEQEEMGPFVSGSGKRTQLNSTAKEQCPISKEEEETLI